jgi:hypothetical protein
MTEDTRFYVSGLSKFNDYNVMLARTKARLRGATPAEIERTIELLERLLAIRKERLRTLAAHLSGGRT